MKSIFSKKHLLGYLAIGLVCIMLGSGITLAVNGGAAQAENTGSTTTTVTSPFTQAVQKVRDSVVGVSNYKTYTASSYGYGRGNNRDNNETREVEYATGSGVVISSSGHVLTNYHVIEGASSVKITVGDETYDAQVIAYDADLDIAIIKADNLGLTPVTLGDSDALQIGDWAICIGNPLSANLSGTTTVGIVSGLNREVTTGTTYDKYGRGTDVTNTMIQVDAAINSGNSGGGMFNTNGELVGIPTIKYSSSSYIFSNTTSIEGIGLCIPINTAKPLIESVLSGEVTAPAATEGAVSGEEGASESSTGTISGGNIGKPRMGVTISTVTSTTFSSVIPDGAYIASIESGSPAEKAGLQVGDIIVEKDGTVITNTTQLLSLVGEMSVDETMVLTVYRAEGLGDVLTRYFNNESITLDEIPINGEYIELTVGLAMLDNIQQ